MLELLNLLTEEDVERNVLGGVQTARSMHSGELLLVLLLNEVRRQLLDQILLKLLLDFVFLAPTSTATGVLGHGVNESVKHGLRLIETEGQIGAHVETEDNRRILLGESLDVLLVLLDLGEVGDDVWEFGERVEVIVLLGEDLVIEPELTIGVEHLTIKIVSNTATVLHIADDEADGAP